MFTSSTKAASSITTSSTLQQPTTAAQSIDHPMVASTATAAASALTALGSAHALRPLSMGSQLALHLQADVKVSFERGKLIVSDKPMAASVSAVAATQTRTISELKAVIRNLSSHKNRSEIAVLVELGKSAGTVDVNRDETNLLINYKINALRNDAKDSSNFSSIRSDLCELIKISSDHYMDLKIKVFDLLIELLEIDPVNKKSAEGILNIIINLNTDLAASEAARLSMLFQKKLARTFSAAVSLYLRHYDQKTHVNAVTEALKKELLNAQDAFSKLNKQGDPAIEFAHEMALEGSKRITDDLSGFSEFLTRLSSFVGALGDLYNKNLADSIDKFKTAFRGLENKIKNEWFEMLFVLREVVQKVPNSSQKVMAIQTLLSEKGIKEDWKFIYGALEILHEVVKQTQDVKVLSVALIGQTAIGVDGELAKETAAVSGTVAQSVSSQLPGVVDFLEFKGYVTKALKAIETHKRADRSIQTKAKELCTSIIEKLSATSEGRLILDPNLTKVKKVLLTLGNPLLNLEAYEAHTPLMLAAQNGYRDVCEALLKAGTNHLSTDRHGSNVLHQAVCDGNVQIVELFAADKQLINSKTKLGCTPLMLAAQEGHKVISELLLKAGADQLATDNDGLNAMHYAAREGKTEIVSMLNKQLINSRATNGSTPLLFAAQRGHLDMCKLLSTVGADLLASNKMGWNTMHWAVDAGKFEIVKWLSVHKELIDAKSKDGVTPLIIAAGQGYLEIFKFLYNVGAVPFAKDENDKNVMHEAARIGNTEMVHLLCCQKQLIDSKAKDGSTPLMYAAHGGHFGVYQALLKEGADALATNKWGWSAMHFAAWIGKAEFITPLLVRTQLINMKTNTGKTPFVIAAEQGHVKVCELLLKTGADPLARDEEDGCNAMHCSAEAGHAEIVQMLLAYKQLINSPLRDGRTPLILAAEQGHENVCELLLKAGADPLATDEDGRNVMHYAAMAGKVEKFIGYKQLIESKDKIVGATPLLFAARQGHLEACKIILKAGANPLATNNEGQNALHIVAFYGKTEIVQLLAKFKQLINSMSKDNVTPLMVAAHQGHLEAFKIILDAGSNPLATDDGGINAMHLAAREGKIEIVRLLSKNKQLIDSKTWNNSTPFMLAAREGHLEVCLELVKDGADPLATDITGYTAMHHAAKCGKITIIRMLSTYGELINSKSKKGDTPLILASEAGHLKVCELLLKAGANPDVVDQDGLNALNWATKVGETKIVNLLSVHTKKMDSKK